MNRSDLSKAAFRPAELVGVACAVAWFIGLTGLGVSLPCVASAQTLSVVETEALVQAVHYEGMSEAEAGRIGPEGCQHLVEMLADPTQAEHHGQIMLAIGICVPVGGFEALRDWADRPRHGEIDRATFRAWQALPFALGHLAQHDRRAFARLEHDLNTSVSPGWTFRQHRGARLVGQARRAAATGLALTGLPEAAQALDRAGASSSDATLRDHVRGLRPVLRSRAAARAQGAARGNGGARR